MKTTLISMFSAFLLLLAGSMIWNSCKKDEDPVIDDFDEYVKALPYAFGAFDNGPQELSTGSESDVGYYCTTTNYSYAAGYDDVILLDPTTDVIAPGMFIKPGVSLVDGNYTPITNAKKPIKLTRSTGEQVTVDNPSLSSIRQGIQEMNQNAGTGAAQINHSSQAVHSKQELRLTVGAHYKNPWADLSAGLNWEQEVEKNFLYAKFVQVYYTVAVDADQKNNPSDWFETPLPDYENWDASPVYVSSVKYGRIGILTMESEASQQDMEAFVNAAFNAMGGSGGFELESEYENLLEKTEFKVMVIGGNPEDAVASIDSGYVGFLSWIKESASFSEDSPGSPVAYSLRYLKDNTPAKVVLSGSYTVKDCYPLPEELYVVQVNGADTSDMLGPFYAHRDENANGDGKFAGHGPMQDAYAELKRREDGDLQLNLYYYAQEWRGYTVPGTGYPGDSEGFFYNEINLVDAGMIKNWPLPANDWKVKEILSPKRSEKNDCYFDDDGYQNVFIGLDSLVNTFKFRGDVSGPDLYIDVSDCTESTCTNMKVKLNPIKVIFEKK